MTPMAGVLICLLVLFFAITPINGCGPWAELPSVSSAWPSTSARAENITVGVSNGGSTFFRGIRLQDGLGELGERVAAYIAENPGVEPVVYLKADVNTHYEKIVALSEVVRKAGATDIRLIAEPFPLTLSW